LWFLLFLLSPERRSVVKCESCPSPFRRFNICFYSWTREICARHAARVRSASTRAPAPPNFPTDSLVAAARAPYRVRRCCDVVKLVSTSNIVGSDDGFYPEVIAPSGWLTDTLVNKVNCCMFPASDTWQHSYFSKLHAVSYPISSIYVVLYYDIWTILWIMIGSDIK